MCEANYDVAGVALVNLEEFPVIDNALYDIVHVVGLVRAVRDDVVEAVVHPGNRVGCRYPRSLLHIVLRDVAQEFLDDPDSVLVIFCSEMCNSALCGVDAGSSEVLGRHVLSGNALHYGRAGEEHIGGVLYHYGKVGEGRGVDRSACARSEDT